jgi:hypothetical protein
MNCFLSNPKRFRKEYFEGSPRLDTKYLRFGKGIAKMIEEGKHKQLLPGLPVYKIPEYEIRVNVLGVPILSYLDSYDPDRNVFIEYKTGTQPWDMARVIKHDQLLMYAVALKHLTGKMPQFCDLVWIKTQVGGLEIDDFWHENEGMVNCTGEIISFHREFKDKEIKRMEDKILKTALEISDAYKKFINEI